MNGKYWSVKKRQACIYKSGKQWRRRTVLQSYLSNGDSKTVKLVPEPKVFRVAAFVAAGRISALCDV